MAEGESERSEWRPPATVGPPPHEGKVRSSGFASASLMFGLLSFCLWLLAVIPAVVLAVLALVEINRSGGRVTGRGTAVAGLLLGFVGFFFAPTLLLPAIDSARQAARLTEAKNTINQVEQALRNYEAKESAPPIDAGTPAPVGEPEARRRVQDAGRMPAQGRAWRASGVA